MVCIVKLFFILKTALKNIQYLAQFLRSYTIVEGLSQFHHWTESHPKEYASFTKKEMFKVIFKEFFVLFVTFFYFWGAWAASPCVYHISG